jgi:hypothetical protein
MQPLDAACCFQRGTYLGYRRGIFYRGFGGRVHYLFGPREDGLQGENEGGKRRASCHRRAGANEKLINSNLKSMTYRACIDPDAAARTISNLGTAVCVARPIRLHCNIHGCGISIGVPELLAQPFVCTGSCSEAQVGDGSRTGEDAASRSGAIEPACSRTSAGVAASSRPASYRC